MIKGVHLRGSRGAVPAREVGGAAQSYGRDTLSVVSGGVLSGGRR